MRLALPPPGAALCLALVLGAPAAAAQSAGDTFVQSGPLWLEPVRTRTAYVRTVLDDSAAAGLLVPRSFGSPALRIEPAGARTLGLSFAHFFTDRLAVELDIGVPPRVEAMGSGRDAPPGLAGPAFAIDLGDPRINPLGSQRQWSPVLALQYRFAPARRWRPFVAAGATYTWFTHEELNPAFVRRLDERFGQALATAAARPGPTTAVAATPDAWAPVAGAGVAVTAGRRWGLIAAVGYAPLTVLPVLEIRAADGARLSRTQARLETEALALTVGLSYRLR
jgi:outer membrane protein